MMESKLKAIAILFLLSTWASAQRLKNLNQIFSWKVLEYGFPSEEDRQYAINNGIYIENTGTPIDVGVQYMSDRNMRVFITTPRFLGGIPFTLATVSNERGPNGPVIYAYPTYEMHNSSNAQCTGIISAFRIAIDECNHMWVIDSGITEMGQVCPPQLLTFDLNTDKLIHRHQFSADVYTPGVSLLVTPVVDISDPPPYGRCHKAMVYIADVDNPGLVVYDAQHNTSWRIENKLMSPDPNFGTHTIAGESFDLMDGLFALNLTPRRKSGFGPFGGKVSDDRYLYFHALSSDTENCVPLRLINNRKIWQADRKAMPEAFRVIGKRGVQSAMEAIDSKGNLYANTNDPLTVFAWNIYNPNYTNDTFKIVANNPEQLQFASGMKVVKHPRGHEELWVSTCRFQKIATDTLNPNETNFRILACKIPDLFDKRGCREMGNLPLHSNLIL